MEGAMRRYWGEYLTPRVRECRPWVGINSLPTVEKGQTLPSREERQGEA